MEKSLPVTKFYGEGYKIKINPKNSATLPPVKYKLKSLVQGPDLTWKVFRKQVEAFDYIEGVGSCGLVPFVFEENNHGRLFLVAHPEVFWHYDSQREPQKRCAYEIIRENVPSKLYFDLEFNLALNPLSNGVGMVDTLIRLLLHLLDKLLNCERTPEDILNLDSTTEKKFSCHLVLPNTVFINNYHAGNFVKMMCREIREALSSQKLTPTLEPCGVSLEELSSLIVVDSKGSKKLFCDESVYSRNRHFRVYRSTKRGKNSPLVLSIQNKYQLKSNDPEKEAFLNSLITYFPGDITGYSQLHFNFNNEEISENQVCGMFTPRHTPTTISNIPSPYPSIDAFILSLVNPGKIYKTCYFKEKERILYSIIGNRYCGNIKREHKSNNVKYIVDLSDYTYYQKCYDYECSQYKSEKFPLPSDICPAQIMEDWIADPNLAQVLDSIEEKFAENEELNISGPDLATVLDIIEQEAFNNFILKEQNKTKFQRFPSFGVPDEDILNACEQY
jgi:hypothetical protein